MKHGEGERPFILGTSLFTKDSHGQSLAVVSTLVRSALLSVNYKVYQYFSIAGRGFFIN